MAEENKGGFPTMLVGAVVLVIAVVAVIFFASKGNQQQTLGVTTAKDKVRLQLKWVPQSQFAGYFVALKKGYFADENLDVTIQPGGVGINPVDVLAAGDTDVAIAWTGNVLPAIAKGEDIVNIGQGLQKTGMTLVAKKSSGILTPADIKGKKIGMWSGGNEVEPTAFIAKQGLNVDKDVTVVSQAFDMNQLYNNEIDVASAMTYNELQLVYESGIKPADLTVFDLDSSGAGMLEDAMFVTRDYLNTHKDVLVRFERAVMKGWDYAVTHQEEAVDMIGMDYTANDVTARPHQINSMKVMAQLYTAGKASTEGLFYIDRASLDNTVKIAQDFVKEVKNGQPIDVNKIYTLDIWTAAKQGVTFSDYSKL